MKKRSTLFAAAFILGSANTAFPDTRPVDGSVNVLQGEFKPVFMDGWTVYPGTTLQFSLTPNLDFSNA